jgi:RNA polymerase sigma factor (sigma-70 family)
MLESFDEHEFVWENFRYIVNFVKKRIPLRLHCITDPEQIAIDAIAQAIRNWQHDTMGRCDGFDHSSLMRRMRAYCIVAAKHLSMNAVRNARRKFDTYSLTIPSERRSGFFDCPDFRISSNHLENVDEYQEFLTHLNAEQKLIMELRIARYSNREIANLLGLSIRTVERFRNEIRQVASTRHIGFTQQLNNDVGRTSPKSA